MKQQKLEQQKLVHYVNPRPRRERNVKNEEVPRPGPRLQPNLAVFGMGLKNVQPTWYTPETLQASFKTNQQRFLELPRGILYTIMRYMTIGDIRKMCETIPGMQEKCRQELEFANTETTASLDFYYIIGDDDGEFFDQGDPVQLYINIRWASPDELIAKLEAIDDFSGQFDSAATGEWHFIQELWDGQMSLGDFVNSIDDMTLEDLQYGEMRWQFDKVGDLADIVPGYDEDFDRDEAEREHGRWWYEHFIPDNAYDELNPFADHVTWNVSHEDADFETELETIMDVNYQRNRNVQQELRGIIAERGANLPQETVNLILQFAGIITPGNEIQRGQGRQRQRLFF